jgi:hypothetical protein
MKVCLIVITLLPMLFPGQGLADTLVLRDGRSFSGSLVKATSHSIEFEDDLGMSHVFPAKAIQELRLSAGGKKKTVSGQVAPRGGDSPATPNSGQSQMIEQLLRRVEQLESTVAELKNAPAQPIPAASSTPPSVDATAPPVYKEVSLTKIAVPSPVSSSVPAVPEPTQAAGVHTMEIPGGGPQLNIRGFFDFNFGVGQNANPLVSPLGAPGTVTFQTGEFDLFMTSKLSDTINFLGEVVIGSDITNAFSVDIERYLLQYKPSDYFQIVTGRFHTAIGWYNTEYHHGTWFQVATGRPYLFLFEDSGGILPVHTVGVSAGGLVPGTGKLNLHWIAEAGNGRSSNPNVQPVQNFLSDKDYKAFNVALYVKPDWLPGSQFGGSYYHDRLVPVPGILPTHVNQSISSAYAVYNTDRWQFLNEAVLMRNQPFGRSVVNTPGFYSQVAKHLAQKYWPYFRYQYVNVPPSDLVNPTVGRQNGPSAGIRWDVAAYAAVKVQYNRLYQRGFTTQNGVDTQLSLTF